MIPYAESIERNDMVAYWGTGFILLNFSGTWSAYRLREVAEDHSCTLRREPGLSDKDAPVNVRLTKEEFFEQALLHRPSLGVVIAKSGEIVHLSWIAARGDKIKSIVPEDVHISTLGWVPDSDKNNPDEPSTLELMEAWADSCKHWRTEWGHLKEDVIFPDKTRITYPGTRRDKKKPARPNVMSLVMQFLNQTQTPFESAVRQALDVGAAVAENGTWLARASKGEAANVYTVGTKLGVAREKADGSIEFVPVKHKLAARQRVINALASRLINTPGGVK